MMSNSLKNGNKFLQWDPCQTYTKMTVFTVLVLCHEHNLASPFHKKAFVQGYRQCCFSYSRKLQYHMKHFTSHKLTQQTYPIRKEGPKLTMLESETVNFLYSFFPLSTSPDKMLILSTHIIAICNLIQKFSPHLEQPGYAIQKEIYMFIFPPLLGQLISTYLSILAQLLSILELCESSSTSECRFVTNKAVGNNLWSLSMMYPTKTKTAH